MPVTEGQILQMVRSTERQQLPSWLEVRRSKFQRFVVNMTRSGAVPISDCSRMTVKLGGELLSPEQRGRFWKFAQKWQDHLLKDAGGQKEGRNVYCVTNNRASLRDN